MKNLDISKLEKCSEPLNENKFWEIVSISLKDTEKEDQQEASLVKQIVKLSPKEIIGFRLRTDKLLYDSYRSELWCAAYIINGGCSDDGFEYFRNWMISRGKETYYQALDNPDTLIDVLSEDMDELEFESFWYVALKAFKQTTGKELYDYIDYEQFKTREGAYPNIEFNWQEEDPKTMKAIAPRLFEKFCQLE